MSEHLTDPDELDEDDLLGEEDLITDEAPDVAELPHPVNWNLLTAEELKVRVVRPGPVGDVAAPHLRATRQRPSAVLASPSRTGVGAVGAASALARRL